MTKEARREAIGPQSGYETDEAPLPTEEARSDTLRAGLVTQLKLQGTITTPLVEAAFRAVPRHLFVPHVSIQEAYRDHSIPTKSLDSGEIVSSSSQPAIMAIMLEQLDVQPGQRVLEIGAGTGYNAALLAYLVGEAGEVVTIDIDEEIVTSARAHLAAAGITNVSVICADGGVGYAASAPFDRIILTAGVWDIAPAWWSQLAADGRMVLPLSIRGPQFAVALEPQDGKLVSRSIVSCGFMRLRGAFAGPGQFFALGPDTGLSVWSEETLPVSAETIYGWLAAPSEKYATQLRLTLHEIWCSLSLWLALRGESMCALSAQGEAATIEMLPTLMQFASHRPLRSTSGLVDANGLCLLQRGFVDGDARDESEGSRVEFPLELRAYGDASALTQRFLAHLHAWDAASRPSVETLRLALYPQDATPAAQEHAVLIPKRWHQLVLWWENQQATNTN